MGLSLTGRGCASGRMPIIAKRSPDLQALKKFLCGIVQKEYPQLHFSSLQLIVNARARLHQDVGNVGYSVVRGMTP